MSDFVYTLEDHQQRLVAIQDLLDNLIELVQRYGLEANTEMGLAAVFHGSVKLLVEFTAPFEGLEVSYDIGFFSLSFLHGSTVEGGSKTWLVNLEYDRESGKVGDSSRFDGNKYLGTGHIQCWHSWSFENEVEEFNKLAVLVSGLKTDFELIKTRFE